MPSMSAGFPASRSLQLVAYEHSPCLQLLVEQSVAVVQARFIAHGLQVLPPQSTSVSLPFLTVSVQLAAAQSLAEQTPLVQSVAATHALESAHFPQVPPPQSTSVSLPFLVVSEQEGAAHTPFTHDPPLQSVAATHTFLSAHFPHAPPPQSTSVSVPFLVPSEQDGAGVIISVGSLPQDAMPSSMIPRTSCGMPNRLLFISVSPWWKLKREKHARRRRS